MRPAPVSCAPINTASKMTSTQAPFHTRIAAAPVLHDRERAERVLAEIERRCSEQADLAPLGAPDRRAARAGPAGGHVRRLALSCKPRRAPPREPAARRSPPRPSSASRSCAARSTPPWPSADSIADAMRALRLFKTDVALLTALCDLAGVWPVMKVTHRLSEAADAAVSAAVRFLFRQAAQVGRVAGRRPRRLHRARHGQARRLRAQLLLRHRPHRLLRSRAASACAPALEVQHFFVRLTRDLVRLLQRAHRRRLRVPHRPAPAPRSRLHAARALDRRRAQLLRELRPELGARRPHQGAARRRRHRRRRGLPARASPPTSGASISTSRPSPTSTP